MPLSDVKSITAEGSDRATMGASYIDQLRARYAYDNYVNGMAVQQLMADAAVIALNRAFGFGPVRAAKFLDAMNQAATDMADLIMEDTNDTEYSRTKIDNELLAQLAEELRDVQLTALACGFRMATEKELEPKMERWRMRCLREDDGR